MFVLYLSINTRAVAAMLPTVGKPKDTLKYECVNILIFPTKQENLEDLVKDK